MQTRIPSTPQNSSAQTSLFVSSGLAKCKFAAELSTAAPRVQGVENRQPLRRWDLGGTGLCPDKRYHHCMSPPCTQMNTVTICFLRAWKGICTFLLCLCTVPDPAAKERCLHPSLLERLPCLPEGLWNVSEDELWHKAWWGVHSPPLPCLDGWDPLLTQVAVHRPLKSIPFLCSACSSPYCSSCHS